MPRSRGFERKVDRMRVRSAIVLATWLAVAALADAVPTLVSTRPVVSIRQGNTLRPDAWRLAPEMNPDVYEAELPDGKPQRVTFITDADSLGFDVEVGKQYDFIIEHGSDRCHTRIVGVRLVPAAAFDAVYRAAHQGKILVEVPEVYELVHIAIARTPTGLADRRLVYQDSDYYRVMRRWFDPWRAHPMLAALDSALAPNLAGSYPRLKMNGYSFVFDGNGRIVQSPVYDRTSFPSERRNSLRPFIEQLQAFADSTSFREFYKRQRLTYDEQIVFFENTADVAAMLHWLDRNFPSAAGYDSYKILFSPLVAYHQSATWLESNGFRELQAHVNYPYPEDIRRITKGKRLSKAATTILRGNTVFTELNHGYINPEADKYAERVVKATSRRDYWVDPAKGPNYYAGISAFNEYMNWGLVSLRAVDFVPPAEQPTLIAIIDHMMTKNRGFPQFAAFDAFLVDRYRHRQAGQTVADLYPQIVEWFAAQNAAARAADRP